MAAGELTDDEVFGTAPPPVPVQSRDLAPIPGSKVAQPAELSDADVFGDEAPKETSQSLGFMEGLAKPLERFQQFNDATLGAIPVIGGLFHTPQAALSAQDRVKQEFAQREQTQRPGLLGQVAGGTVGTLPFTAALGPFAGGAVGGGLLSDAKSPQGVAADALLSGIAGKAGDVVLKGVTSLVSPTVRSAAQWALDRGISLQPGAIIGGGAHSAENFLSRTPFLGDLIRNSQNRTLADFNVATGNEVLKDAGLSLPPATGAGHEAVNATFDALSKGYKSIIPKLTLTQDQAFGTDLASLKQQAANLDGSYKTRANRLIKRIEGGLGQPGGSMTGAQFDTIDDSLGADARKGSQSSDLFANDYGAFAGNARTALLDLAQRSNPLYAQQLAGLNKSWGKYVAMERAATAASQREGVFTPNELVTGSRATDLSARDNRTARGLGEMQQFANSAKAVVPNTPPKPGHWLEQLAELLVTAGVAKEAHMTYTVPAALGGVALSGLYTKPGQKAATALLSAPRGPNAIALANLMQKLQPLISAYGAAQGAQFQLGQNLDPAMAAAP